MKSIATLALATLAGLSAAAAADLPSMKDYRHETVTESVIDRSGFYITGAFGVAEGDRSISRDVRRNLDANIDVTGVDADDLAAARAQLDAAGIPNTLDGNNLNIPLIGDRLGWSDDNDFSGFVFGGGISYLYQLPSSRVGISIGVDGTFYNDSDTSNGYTDRVGTFTGGTAAADINTGGFTCTQLGTCAGEPAVIGTTPLTQSGFVAFERDYDVDLPIEVHYFVTDRLAFSIGAGPSWARASARGANANSVDTTGLPPELSPLVGGLNTSFDDDDTSLGYVIKGGVKYWATDRLVVGVVADYKQHEFEFDAASSGTLALDGGNLTTRSSDKVTIEDDVWTVKGTVSLKLF